MAETWLTTPEVAVWLTEKRGRPTTEATARAWLLRHYVGDVRVGRSPSGRGRPNLYEVGRLEAALAGMAGQGGPGKPRRKRTTDGGETTS